MTYTRQYPQTITADGTDVQTGFENDDNELKRIYGLLDSVGAISLAGTKRQSVLYASTLNGEPSFISASGLNISLDGSTTNVLLAFAYGFDDKGAVDYLNKISTLVTNAWTLPGNSTVYLYIDRDISTNLISYNYSSLEDLYQKATPTATLDQHWYDTNECKMKRYNGSTWEVKQRLFVAKAVTNDTAVTLTIYPLQSRSQQYINIMGNLTGNADTASKVNHALTIGGIAYDGSEALIVESATQEEAEAGAENSKIMTALRVKQALAALITSITNSAGFVFNNAQNGYLKLPNFLGGFIFQWMKITATGTYTLPITFPNAIRGILASSTINPTISTTQVVINDLNYGPSPKPSSVWLLMIGS